ARDLEAADRAPTRAWIDRGPVGYLLVALQGDEGIQMDRAVSLDPGELRGLVPSITEDAERAWLIEDGGRRVDPMALTVGIALLAKEAGATVRHHLSARTLMEDRDRIAGGGALINPHPDGSVLVGSSREPAIGPEPADPEVVRRQLADAIRLIPSLGSAAVESTWWGIRPMSPDDRPMIGRLSDGLIIA